MRLVTIRLLTITLILLVTMSDNTTAAELAGAAGPVAPTALEQQLASVQLQHESVQKQVASLQPRVGQKIHRQVHPVSLVEFADPVPAQMPAAPWPVLTAQFDCPPLSPFEADTLIGSAARTEQISPSLLRAVIKRESGFRPCAVSTAGAQGLMQLMPATAQQFGVFDPFDPQDNVRGGASLLKQLLARYGGDVRLALSAYNAGPQRVDQTGGVPDIPETQNYVASITGDLGMTNSWNASPATAEPNSPEPVNLVTKPDLRHVVLASPSLDFTLKATPVHLATEQ